MLAVSFDDVPINILLYASFKLVTASSRSMETLSVLQVALCMFLTWLLIMWFTLFPLWYLAIVLSYF